MRIKALVEAALFISDKPLTVEKISRVLNLEEGPVRRAIEELKGEKKNEESGIELVETPEGYEFRVKPEYREKIAVFAPFSDISDGMMRTLAIVALKQPIKQSVIVKYQGNKAYGYIKKLEEKGLIKTEKYGRTKLVRLSQGFESYFGKSADEVRKILERSL